MPQKVLSDDWSEYDNHQKKKTDKLFFSCEESWEREYLVRKIHRLYPQFSPAAITSAILTCCEQVRAPRPRHIFVQCVMGRLRS